MDLLGDDDIRVIVTFMDTAGGDGFSEVEFKEALQHLLSIPM